MDDSRIQAMRDNRVYISGPVTGIDDYMERFSKAEKELEAQGFGVINPAKVNAQLPADITTYEEYMNMCTHIYMLKGWEKSTGANREFGYALASDMIIMRE